METLTDSISCSCVKTLGVSGLRSEVSLSSECLSSDRVAGCFFFFPFSFFLLACAVFKFRGSKSAVDNLYTFSLYFLQTIHWCRATYQPRSTVPFKVRTARGKQKQQTKQTKKRKKKGRRRKGAIHFGRRTTHHSIIVSQQQQILAPQTQAQEDKLVPGLTCVAFLCACVCVSLRVNALAHQSPDKAGRERASQRASEPASTLKQHTETQTHKPQGFA